MPNKRIRKKQAKKLLKTRNAYIPNNTFRSSMSIQSTLFNPNDSQMRKVILTAESNLNRLSLIITKPNIVNLRNLTKDDVKYLASKRFFDIVHHLQEYTKYDRNYYRSSKHRKVENIIRKVINEYYEARGITTTKALTNSIIRLNKQLDKIAMKYGGGVANPFVIVFYEDLDLR